MQRISFVAACEFLLMFPGVYLKVTSIWERVWDCFVFFPLFTCPIFMPVQMIAQTPNNILTVYRRPMSCFDRKPPKTSKRVHTGSKQGCPCCVFFITYAKVNHSSMLMFVEFPEFFTTVIQGDSVSRPAGSSEGDQCGMFIVRLYQQSTVLYQRCLQMMALGVEIMCVNLVLFHTSEGFLPQLNAFPYVISLLTSHQCIFNRLYKTYLLTE